MTGQALKAKLKTVGSRSNYWQVRQLLAVTPPGVGKGGGEGSSGRRASCGREAEAGQGGGARLGRGDAVPDTARGQRAPALANTLT